MTDQEVLDVWLPLVRRKARFIDPYRRGGHPPTASLHPKFVAAQQVDDRFQHWDHKNRHVEGCEDCVRRVYQRRRRAQARADRRVKLEAIDLGLLDWEDRVSPEDFMEEKEPDPFAED